MNRQRSPALVVASMPILCLDRNSRTACCQVQEENLPLVLCGAMRSWKSELSMVRIEFRLGTEASALSSELGVAGRLELLCWLI